ncbi:Crp/Fnr family transcriptional regulator [Marinobacter nanhaiticus D15-8W]|uniref:Crp/Fnr family transcriptional regulator n=1 Tax=Marinobacter nanhaiticus D15-8W TaxID=626887 RepID=N6W7K2_9GAMM|nr:Crp/Fnr family transcriptional regulator [Marinobacter nanhaiticus]ENO16194.1 Crp/Fnr family transcriptional regulator [Marinobacter nanhaiticus D15-8W]BES72949.1 Crp/Fnr family transcriptional regulator [Marinobacter nanhaiticus D15-8W]
MNTRPDPLKTPLGPLVAKLQKCTFVTHEDAEELYSLALEVRTLKRGQELVSQGQTLNDLHFVQKGWACRKKLLKDGTAFTIGYLLPGDCTGLTSAMGYTFDHAIEAVTDLTVVRVDTQSFNELKTSNPRLAQGFSLIRLTNEFISRSQMINLGAMPAEQRIGQLLCDLIHRAEQSDPDGKNSLTVPLSQIDIASATGLSPVHVNRVLQKLRKEGLVDTHQQGGIRLSNWEKLAAFSGYEKTDPVKQPSSKEGLSSRLRGQFDRRDE